MDGFYTSSYSILYSLIDWKRALEEGKNCQGGNYMDQGGNPHFFVYF